MHKGLELFLADVEAQIQYKPTVSHIQNELKEHVEDLAEEYLAEGLADEAAMSRAVTEMGDPSEIGAMMNRVHRVRMPWMLIVIIMASVGIGMLGNIAGEYLANRGSVWYRYYIGSSSYFLIGMVILAVVSLWGYPLLVRYENLLLGLNAMFVLAVVLFNGFLIDGTTLAWHAGVSNLMRLDQPAIMLAGPAIVVLTYKTRYQKERGFLIVLGCLMFLVVAVGPYTEWSSNFSYKMIMILAIGSVWLYMAMKGMLRVPVRRGVLMSLTGIGLVLGIWGARNQGTNFGLLSYQLQQCLQPEARMIDHWDDSYNSILIKDLLSRAKLTGGVEFTREELEAYRTGEWYFDEQYFEALDFNQISYRMQGMEEMDLADILPQHYHNNYRIAYWILTYGWLPAMVLVTMVLGTVILLAVVTDQIHNRLGHLVALVCVICLGSQSLLYVMGNLGYQFGCFTALPFVSEGLASIAVNMIFAGLIVSAYRYDRVVWEEDHSARLMRFKLV